MIITLYIYKINNFVLLKYFKRMKNHTRGDRYEKQVVFDWFGCFCEYGFYSLYNISSKRHTNGYEYKWL